MNNNRFDVAIVGAGPAGASAAYVLAKHGMKVCLIDNNIFPRNKLCGGLLTSRTRKVFHDIYEQSWDPIIDNVTDGVKFFYKHRKLNEIRHYKSLYFTKRIVFDSYLVKQAINKGAIPYFGMRVVSIDENTLIVTFDSKRNVKADFIIGADGVNSVVAKCLFKKPFDNNNLALGLELELDRNIYNNNIVVPEIHFGVLKWGYGWVFPKKETVTIGIGGLLRYNAYIYKSFLEFIKMLIPVQIDKYAIRGHHIPFGNYKKYPGRNNILLCGDAAGLVDPITGEGITYALLSGKYAAESIIETTKIYNTNKAFELYLYKYNTIANTLQQAIFLRYLLFPKIAESIFIKILPNTNSVPIKYIDLISGDITYLDFIRFLTGKIIKGSIKNILGIKK